MVIIDLPTFCKCLNKIAINDEINLQWRTKLKSIYPHISKWFTGLNFISVNIFVTLSFASKPVQFKKLLSSFSILSTTFSSAKLNTALNDLQQVLYTHVIFNVALC